MKVIVEYRYSPRIEASMSLSEFADAAPAIERELDYGFKLDANFAAVKIPKLRPLASAAMAFALEQPFSFSMEPKESTYVVRGEIADDLRSQQAVLSSLYRRAEIVGVFSDPQIESCPICPGDPASGTDADVATLLNVTALSSQGLDGTGVWVAVVDTGINLGHLRAKGRSPVLDATRSWTPAGVPTTPGNHPVQHGTMCAYDVGISAPNATLLDHAVLLSRTPGASAMAGLLSDAIRSYSMLLGLIGALPDNSRRLVVTNSWGMYDPSWDFPVGHPGNYSDNISHPFNVVVASLESAGADILFAAGNCGRTCPAAQCNFGGTLSICGANSHPKVLTIAGIDVKKGWVGYSSQGPGRLYQRKPSLSAYTHFSGSGVWPIDSGTSAACPVAAGVVACVRTRHPSSDISPFELRSLLYKTAEDLSKTGFDYDYGWGTFNTPALLAALHDAVSPVP